MKIAQYIVSITTKPICILCSLAVAHCVPFMDDFLLFGLTSAGLLEYKMSSFYPWHSNETSDILKLFSVFAFPYTSLLDEKFF